MLENYKFPVPDNDCTPGDCPMDRPKPIIPPPHIPSGTLNEEFLRVSKRVHETLHRVLDLEKNIKERLNGCIDVITTDNAEFKKLCMQTYNEFSDRVTLEVNNFTSSITNSYNALMKTWESAIDGVDKAYLAELDNFKKEINQKESQFTSNITTQFNSFKKTVNDKLAEQDRTITESVVYIKSNISQYITNLVQQMQENGEIDEAIAQAYVSLGNRITSINGLVTTQGEQINELFSAFNGNTFNWSYEICLKDDPTYSVASLIEEIAECAVDMGYMSIDFVPNFQIILDRPVTIPLININGGGCEFKFADDYAGDRSYMFKFTCSLEEYRERVIRDMFINCAGVTGSAIIIEDTRNDKFENITLLNCDECTGIEIKSGFGSYFNNVNINHNYNSKTPTGTGIIIRTSDLHFNNININGKMVGIEDRGINILDKVHIWQGVETVAEGNNANTVGIYKKNGGLYNNIYFDSLETCMKFEASAQVSIKNCLWLVNYTGVSKFVENETENQPLSHFRVDGLNIMNNKNTNIDFGGYDAYYTNVTPRSYANQASTVKKTISNNFQVLNQANEILRVGEMLHFDIHLKASKYCNMGHQLITLENYPLNKAHKLNCKVSTVNASGEVIETSEHTITIANAIQLPVEISANSTIEIYGSVPLY